MVAQTRQTEAICLALFSSDLQRKDHPLRVLFLELSVEAQENRRAIIDRYYSTCACMRSKEW